MTIRERFRNLFKRDPTNAAFGSGTASETVSRVVELFASGRVRHNGDMLSNDLVNQAIRANATHTSKAHARVVVRKPNNQVEKSDRDKRIERLLNQNPCPGFTGRDFLYRMRALCDWKGVAFALVRKNPLNNEIIGVYPIYYSGGRAFANQDKTQIIAYEFTLPNGKVLPALRDELIVVKRSVMTEEAFGDDNRTIYHTLDMLATADKGLADAIRLTSAIRGILKSKNAMVKDADRRRMQEDFVRDFVTDSDGSGLAALDATMEFMPVNITPTTADEKQVALYENRIKREFGVNDAILMNEFNEDKWNAYYEGNIEPFLIALAQAATLAIFTERERALGNEIFFESGRLVYASSKAKLALAGLVDRGIWTPNEYRSYVWNQAPYDGGNEHVIRREYGSTAEVIEGRNGTENEQAGGDGDAI